MTCGMKGGELSSLHVSCVLCKHTYYFTVLVHSVYTPLIRVTSRTVIIEFSEPPVGPSTPEEEEAFEEFDGLLHSSTVSAAIGWAIRQEQAIMAGKSAVSSLKSRLREACPLLHRNVQNWAVLLFLLEQVNVSNINFDTEIGVQLLTVLSCADPAQLLKETGISSDLEEFVQFISRTTGTSSVQAASGVGFTQDAKSVLLQCMHELVTHARNTSRGQVSH